MTLMYLKIYAFLHESIVIHSIIQSMNSERDSLQSCEISSNCDEDQIDDYNKLLMENFKSQGSSFIEYQDLEDFDDDSRSVVETERSFKSMQSMQSIRSMSSFQQNSIQSQRTSKNSLKEDTQRLKMFKHQQRRIKEELKKQNKKAIDSFSIDEKEKKKVNKPRGKKLKLTRRTLELLGKKFQDYYSFENRYDSKKGPKMTIRDIGRLFDMGSSTVHKLYGEWMQDPGFEVRFTKETQKKKNPQRKCTLERLQQINRLIKENPFLTQNQLTSQLNKIQTLKYIKDGKTIDITRTTVARLLKVGKFKKKRVKCVPKERNTQKSFQKRYQYCSKYKQITDRGGRIFFLDESGFNLYMTRDKAWARPNEEITVNCPISKGKRFSLIAIIGQEGVAHWRIIEGTYRKFEYLDFVKEFFAKIQEQQKNQLENEEGSLQRWLVLDNCAIHDKEQTVTLAAKCGMQILYLPPYSPQLNPIQYWFHEVKSIVRKVTYTKEEELLFIMERTIKGFEEFSFANYYKGVEKHVDKGIKREKF